MYRTKYGKYHHIASCSFHCCAHHLKVGMSNSKISEDKKILMPELFIPLFLVLGHELSFSWGGKYLFFSQVWENVGA